MAGLFLVPQTLEISISPITDAVPEPSTWAMLLTGLAGIGFATYQRKLEPKRKKKDESGLVSRPDPVLGT